ncbi:ABC transporter permease [Agaricicola taiwanensis]|uniref:ABC transporter permease n=1 Tax=Agaricicola taiwanensis TaxID=591372 RepID=A0A8J2YHH5_9RHOB|nr:ABC transporter permease [Agaricicola taiwanensis]GGE43052.1 ABC transporter permease [Agaricicola taiwanensis]
MNQDSTQSRAEPSLAIEPGKDALVLRADGDWTKTAARDLEQMADEASSHLAQASNVVLDLDQLDRMDSVGAIMLGRLLHDAEGAGASITVRGASKEQETLIESAQRTQALPEPKRGGGSIVDVLEDIGHGVVGAFSDVKASVGFLGSIVAGMGGVLLRPRTFRGTSVVFHLEQVAFRSLPIIGLISFVVGAIVSQQSIFQLRGFGAEIFVVDLIGILTVRELGVLLTAIMMAGRSGSAFTAEIGSMKMREEIDALRTMALDPIAVLVLPRLFALVIGLTLMAFMASLFSILGGGVVAWIYGNISPEIFLNRLKETLTVSSFMVGIIKAPFMGIVIGIIATVEGLRVEGSAESLGQRTTASVVKAIFVVIVLDGLFAMFFAALGW